MNKISAKVVADSVNDKGNRLTTMEVVFPRIILAELNTHRLFTRNSASSRAIPFQKMVRNIRENLFIPIAWQKDHSGMQGTQYFEGWRAKVIEMAWIAASKLAIGAATKLNRLGLTKQLANRLLEPFMYHKVLVTFTESENFFNLRAPQYVLEKSREFAGHKFKSRKELQIQLKDSHPIAYEESFKLTDIDWLKMNKGQGEIHIMDLAEKMLDALNESTPKLLSPGEWHVPYKENMDFTEIDYLTNWNNSGGTRQEETLNLTLKIAIARCARLSYQTLGDNPKIDYEADINLFNILKESGHFSPFEHVARCMTNEEYYTSVKTQINRPEKESVGWCGNFRGFIQYRFLIE